MNKSLIITIDRLLKESSGPDSEYTPEDRMRMFGRDARQAFDRIKDFAEDVRGGAETIFVDENGQLLDDLYVRGQGSVWKFPADGDIPDFVDASELEGRRILRPSEALQILEEADNPALDNIIENVRNARFIDDDIGRIGNQLANNIQELNEISGRPELSLSAGERFQEAYREFRRNYLSFLAIKRRWVASVRKVKTFFTRMFARDIDKFEKKLFNQADEDIKRLKRKLDRQAFRYSRRLVPALKASAVADDAVGAYRRASSFGRSIKIPFGHLFTKDGSIIRRFIGFMKPYSQMDIDPEIGQSFRDDKFSTGQERTKKFGDEDIKRQAARFRSEGKALKEMADDTKIEFNSAIDEKTRLELEYKEYTQRESASLYNEIADRLEKVHKYSRRGARAQDSLKLVYRAIKFALITTMWSTPPKGATARKPIILLRILGLVFAGSFAYDTYVEYFDRFKNYVGEEIAASLIWAIEADPGIELVLGEPLGDIFLQILTDINQSANKKLAAAKCSNPDCFDRAGLDIAEIGVLKQLHKKYGADQDLQLKRPWSTRRLQYGQTEFDDDVPEPNPYPIGDLLENINKKSLKIVLG